MIIRVQASNTIKLGGGRRGIKVYIFLRSGEQDWVTLAGVGAMLLCALVFCLASLCMSLEADVALGQC